MYCGNTISLFKPTIGSRQQRRPPVINIIKSMLLSVAVEDITIAFIMIKQMYI